MYKRSLSVIIVLVINREKDGGYRHIYVEQKYAGLQYGKLVSPTPTGLGNNMVDDIKIIDLDPVSTY